MQEERLGAEKGEMEAESTTAGGEMLIDSILSAEMRNDSNSDGGQTVEDVDTMSPYSWNSVCSQISHTVVDWAMAVPHFTELSPDDQLMILKAGISEYCVVIVLLPSVMSAVYRFTCVSLSLYHLGPHSRNFLGKSQEDFLS